MKIVRETLPKMFCKYCVVYIDCISDNRFVNGERYCPAIKKPVDGRSKICSSFSIGKSFWCEQFDYWQDIAACLARQKRRFEGCTRCSQGSMIQGYLILKERGH